MTTLDPLRGKDISMAEHSDTRSACPSCGEWRDSPTSDCANCGFPLAVEPPAPREAADATCPFLGCRGQRGHGTPHLFEAPDIEGFRLSALNEARAEVADEMDAIRGTAAELDVERLARALFADLTTLAWDDAPDTLTVPMQRKAESIAAEYAHLAQPDTEP